MSTSKLRCYDSELEDDENYPSPWLPAKGPGVPPLEDDEVPFGLETRSRTKHRKGVRAERWRKETDPFRARVLYQMAAVGYQARTGREATPALLNREYPATTLKPRPHGSWNLTRLGKHLPRAATMAQGHAMRALAEQDPEAAAVFDWVLWPLASHQVMALPEVHAAMLRLDGSVRDWLMGTFWTDRFQRWNNDRMLEIEWMRRTSTISSLVALLALLREAELRQDASVYERAYVVLREHLPLLRSHPGLSVVANEFGEYLLQRFKWMCYVLPDAYTEGPGTGMVRPVLIKLLNAHTSLNIAAIEFLWRGENRRVKPEFPDLDE